MIYLSAKAFIEAINPKQPKKNRGGCRGSSVDEIDANESDNDGREGEWTVDWARIALDEDIEGLPQVHMSSQAKVYFTMVCKEEGLKPLELIKWIHIHWRSMVDLIKRALVN